MPLGRQSACNYCNNIMQNQHNLKTSQPNGNSEADIVFNTNIIVIDLEDLYSRQDAHPKDDPGILVHYLVKVDAIKHKFKHPIISGADLFAASGKDPKRYQLLQVFSGSTHGSREEVIKIGDSIDLRTYGIEKFETRLRITKFHIDREHFTVEEPCLTVLQILVDFAKVDPAVKTLADKKTLHEYKDFQEVICLEDGQHFTLFDNNPCTVS